MVRAAASGIVDYTHADPADNRWRIKHRLLLLELQRQEDQRMSENMHRHWCAYIGHGNLTPDSFDNVKQTAAKTITNIQRDIFPWAVPAEEPEIAETPDNAEKAETQPENSKIDDESKKLIERFKIWRQEKSAKTSKP